MKPFWLPALLALPMVVHSHAASAHKMKVFAAADGAVVSGYVYFSPGGRAQDAAIIATIPDGTVIFHGRTDPEGGFRFEAGQRTDLRIAADGGDGHEASFIVKAAELPEALPALPPPGTTATVAVQPIIGQPIIGQPVTAQPSAELAALVEQSVARQVRPLREQLDAFQDAVQWHDVLGGIGYIIGLGGLAYGLAIRPRRRRQPSATVTRSEAAR